MAAIVLPMTKRIELFSAKKFAIAALENNDKSLCGSVLKVKNVPLTILVKYSDYTNVDPSDSTTELPKHTSVNNHPISLVYDCPPALQYCSSARKTVTSDCA